MNSDYKFIFDLDATITQKDILPEISRTVGLYDKIKELTDLAMNGNIPFNEAFNERIQLLKDIPLEIAQSTTLNIPLYERIVSFIKENKKRCLILTSNIDVWIDPLMKKIGVEYYSSKVKIENNKIQTLSSIMDKSSFTSDLNYKYIGIGDGDNDIDLLMNAEVGIVFGGVRNPSSTILSVASHAIYEEDTLCQFLKRLL